MIPTADSQERSPSGAIRHWTEKSGGDSNPAEPNMYNSECRTASNKRKRAATIPIDAELATGLDR